MDAILMKLTDPNIIDLAKRIVDEVELGSPRADHLVRLGMRLAGTLQNETISKWLNMEYYGYHSFDDPFTQKYISLTQRWTDYDRQEAMTAGVIAYENFLDTLQIEIDVRRSFVPQNAQYAYSHFEINRQ